MKQVQRGAGTGPRSRGFQGPNLTLLALCWPAGWEELERSPSGKGLTSFSRNFSFPRVGIVTRPRTGPPTKPVSPSCLLISMETPRGCQAQTPHCLSPSGASQNIRLLSKSHPSLSLSSSSGEKAGRNICQVLPYQLEAPSLGCHGNLCPAPLLPCPY